MPGRTPAARPPAPARTRLRLADAGPFARGAVAAVVAVAALVIAGHACPARAAGAAPAPVARHAQP
ncbi:hypothetical protein EV284_5072 [Streptomyces sp. BK022]|uniref:hypothetical protein n=1 Tax=Streptomyces sp. BK022 TaxID=2512123 RepID=UPI0010293133|nr:hypothetical protein [Streptomyces sp. BK022]RZU30116.1 hypothetical protein EV284_5072 [Streptomyces sp. BK022]